MEKDIPTDYSNVAPRIGFSILLRPTTVLRGGYGLSVHLRIDTIDASYLQRAGNRRGTRRERLQIVEVRDVIVRFGERRKDVITNSSEYREPLVHLPTVLHKAAWFVAG